MLLAVYRPRYGTLIHSMAKWAIKHEFSGECPKTGIMGCVLIYRLHSWKRSRTGSTRIGRLDVTLGDWIAGIWDKRFQWNDGAWLVSANEILPGRDLSISGHKAEGDSSDRLKSTTTINLLSRKRGENTRV